MDNITKQNFAFISYNHKDVKWAKWLRRKLEWYRLPSEINNEFEDSRYIRPVFRDREELDSGVLSVELHKRLENSKHLIVICSQNSAKSQWVSDEVQTFIDMGKQEYIIPFIVEGEPQIYNDAQSCDLPFMGECFPKALRRWNTEHPKNSLLGIAVSDDGETNKQKAFIRVVSRMLGVSFDTLWKRHKRELFAKIVTSSIVSIIALVLSYWFMIPVSLHVFVKDEQSSLPGMETGILNVEGNEYSIIHPNTIVKVANLPGYYRLRDLKLSFKANRYYNEEHVFSKVTAGFSQTDTLFLHRDSTFAVFGGQVLCEDSKGELVPLIGATVLVENKSSETDCNGSFSITFHVSEQSETKPIKISKEGLQSINRNDEVPSTNLKYIMHIAK